MQAIYASKIYKSSPRKDKIRAAIENPVNAELVTQLAEYLDEEYQQPQYLEGAPEHLASIDSKGQSSQGDSSGGSSSPAGGGFSGGGGGSAPSMNMDDVVLDKDGNPMEGPEDLESLEDENLEDNPVSSDLSEVNDDESIPDEGLQDVEEATTISDTVGDKDLYDSGVMSDDFTSDTLDYSGEDQAPYDTSSENILHDNVESIKTMLNATSDTSGVERLQIKDSELWIYYNDYTNLNNIMSPVIEFFNNGNFTYLEFNRLARSTNAIVFQICTDDTRL